MKKTLSIVAALAFVAVGCESWDHNDRDSMSRDQSTTINESSGAQSSTSNPNQASSSSNVGQSGNNTPSSTASPEQSDTGTATNSTPQNNSPQ